MRTTFGSFNIATTGLFASQRSLDITSHNISNANTEGYSRQSVLQRASMPVNSGIDGITGTGVETYDVIRMRSEYLDQKYWGQAKSFQEWKTKQDGLGYVEGIFNEPSDTGIRKVMDDFFTSLDNMVKGSGDNTNRVAVAEKASTFAATINRNGHEILDSIRDTNFTIKTKVDEVNAIANQITVLNKQIFNLELGKNKANDLRDQRNVLVDRLSQIANVTVNEYVGEDSNQYFNVKIGGVTLINHFNYNKLTIVNQDKPGITDLGGGKISQVCWEGTDGSPLGPVNVESGELKGLLDMRDGDGLGSNYRGLPFYLEQLNRFARDFAAEFNAQHRTGVDNYGNAGGNFFEEPNGADMVNKWKNINCVNFKVDQQLISDPGRIAAASAANGESNNENAKILVNFRNKLDIFNAVAAPGKIKGTPDDFVKSFLSALAVDSSQAKRMSENSEVIVEQTKNQRMSDSGVSIDEEMTNMVKFQQAYNASARMITTLDKVLDTAINRLGLVGR